MHSQLQRTLAACDHIQQLGVAEELTLQPFCVAFQVIGLLAKPVAELAHYAGSYWFTLGPYQAQMAWFPNTTSLTPDNVFTFNVPYSKAINSLLLPCIFPDLAFRPARKKKQVSVSRQRFYWNRLYFNLYILLIQKKPKEYNQSIENKRHKVYRYVSISITR
jgi:hypothetical protein